MVTDTCAKPVAVVVETPDMDPLPNRRRVVLLGIEVVAAVAAAALVSGLVQWAVDALPIRYKSNVPIALTWSVVFVLSCVVVVLLWRRWSRSSTVLAWLLPAAFTSTVQALTLAGTPFYLFGTNGDQFFRIQYLQRLTVSASLADDNYLGIPPYYPAGWFWLGGRFASLIGRPAWAAYKPFAILTIAVVAALAFVLWSLLVSRKKALGIAMVFALTGTILGAYEPYSWVATVVIPPLAVLAWRLFRTIAERRGAAGPGPATVLLGLIGLGISVCAATYTLLFGFAVLLVVAAAVVAAAVATVRSKARWSTVVVRLGLIGLAALPITLLVWAPYLYSAMRMPTGRNAAPQFFPIGMATLGTPMLQPTVTGVICMIGLVWIVVAWRRNPVAQAFGITAAACVVWQLSSTLALADNTTLLSSHIAQVGEIVLWCACAFAVFDLVESLPRRLHISSPQCTRVLASVLAVLVAVQLTQFRPDSIKALLGGAYTSYDADGHVVDAAKATDQWGPYNKQLIDVIAQLSGRPAQDNVLLTNDFQLLDFQPYHSFQTNKEQYANPLARYPERNEELVRWARSSSPSEFLSKLSASEFTLPNVFVFTRDAAGDYVFDINWTNFPYENTGRRLTFPAELFASPQFVSREVGPFTVIVRR
ncbi:arabinofuranosyltransferase [Labedaea rhizosphaerae]|uniref:Galactan 5-O-arabinofuranosyltransferase n=1 Tax=Labedaea rhizosphaerae TaxID=598644 RepID=A0A4R6S0S1_LABRH|nr:arabinofuranosyltransferase [Labedaea rhizosphaerae]TDP92823.1 galactan 5-O-arabinofuranosyltransferase [Labedaea rhizosphaerae]